MALSHLRNTATETYGGLKVLLSWGRLTLSRCLHLPVASEGPVNGTLTCV